MHLHEIYEKNSLRLRSVEPFPVHEIVVKIEQKIIIRTFYAYKIYIYLFNIVYIYITGTRCFWRGVTEFIEILIFCVRRLPSHDFAKLNNIVLLFTPILYEINNYCAERILSSLLSRRVNKSNYYSMPTSPYGFHERMFFSRLCSIHNHIDIII